MLRGDISGKIIVFGVMYIRKWRVTLPCAGEWVDFLGMKDSAKYVGTPQSIAVRIPDCSVTTHLIDLVSGHRHSSQQRWPPDLAVPLSMEQGWCQSLTPRSSRLLGRGEG